MLRCDGCGYVDSDEQFTVDRSVGAYQCPVCDGYGLGDAYQRNEGAYYHEESGCALDGGVCGDCSTHVCRRGRHAPGCWGAL